jgi:hypothetical protein
LDHEFPRSIHYCLTTANDSLHAISGTPIGMYRNTAEQRLGQLRAELAYTDTRQIVARGPHEFLDAFQTKLNHIDQCIYDTFFALRPVGSGAPDPSWTISGWRAGSARLAGNLPMYFEISHKTTYTYSRPVFLEPHQLRVRPRCDGLQNLTDFDSKLQPRPAGSSDSMDLDGNVVSNIWFEGLTERFVIESRAKVWTQYRNPFLYILADRADRLPISYMEMIKPYVAPYVTRLGDSDLVERFARQIANQTEWKTLRFLSALNREIYECCQQTRPEPGVLHVAEQTLLSKHGSCPRYGRAFHRSLPLRRYRRALCQRLSHQRRG